MWGPLIAITLSLGPVASAHALPPEHPSSRPPLSGGRPLAPAAPSERRFDGGHLGVQLGGGWAAPDDAGSGALWGGRVALRGATLLQILDAEVFAETGTGALDGGRLGRTAAGVQVSGHPLFVGLVWDSFAAWLAAGFHVFASVAAARVSLEGAPVLARVGRAGSDVSLWGLAPSLGAGLDVPLSSRTRGSGLWLTLRWQLRWLSVGPNPAQSLDLGDQQVSLALGWRVYGVGSGP